MKRINTCKIALAVSILIYLFTVQSAWPIDNQWQERPIKLGTSGGIVMTQSSQLPPQAKHRAVLDLKYVFDLKLTKLY